MASAPFSQRAINSLIRPMRIIWGRLANRSYLDDQPPFSNPDDTPNETYFDMSQNPHIKSGQNFRDLSNLPVSARGLEPDESGASFPAQLIYTTPDVGDPEILDFLAWQYDEGFTGGFNQIFKSLEDPCKTYGRAIGKLHFAKVEKGPWKGKIYTPFIESEDPEEYIFDPPDEKPGLYKQVTFGNLERMNDNQYIHYAYDPLYNNPYGTSINYPLKPWITSWNKVFGYWRHALEKAGLGSWTAEYDNTLVGESTEATRRRAQLLEQVKLIASGSASIIHQAATLQSHKLQMEAEAFLNWYNSFVQTVSILYTGNATALTEGKFGSRAKSEATDIREKSKFEQIDAIRISAFWTYEYNPRMVDLNFAPDRIIIYPTYQLIEPKRILPTTPKDQEQVDDETEQPEQPEQSEQSEEREEEEKKELMFPISLQNEEEEPKEPKQPPLAVPPTYQDFPGTEPLPDIYQQIIEQAQDILQQMPVKNFDDVQPAEAPHTFTIKRLRSFEGSVVLLTTLKDAIIPTLEEPTEAEAWAQYYLQAVQIFRGQGIEMTPAIRSNLIISFRQARQNAYGKAVRALAEEDDSIVGFQIKAILDERTRFISKLWNGITLAVDDPLWEIVASPSDFGDRGWEIPVFDTALITPKDQLPKVFPGETYRGYAQPKEREPEVS